MLLNRAPRDGTVMCTTSQYDAVMLMTTTADAELDFLDELLLASSHETVISTERHQQQTQCPS